MVHGFRQGEHICSLYDTEEEQLATAAAYLADGIWRVNGACMSGRIETRCLRFRAALGAAGLDAGALVERGALIELTHEDAYLADGQFSIERMLTMLNESIQQATRRRLLGLAGVR